MKIKLRHFEVRYKVNEIGSRFYLDLDRISCTVNLLRPNAVSMLTLTVIKQLNKVKSLYPQ